MKNILFILFLLLWSSLSGQVNVFHISATHAVSNLISDTTFIKYRNPKLIGDSSALGEFHSSGTRIGIDEGIIISSGNVLGIATLDTVEDYTTYLAQPGHPLFDSLSLDRFRSYDATLLSFDLKSEVSVIQVSFIFASEEYEEYVNRIFNDVFGLFITGPGYKDSSNLLWVPGTNLPIAVNSINHLRNSEYYINNTNINIQADGFTTKIILDIHIVPCEWYKISIGIADIGDWILDSWAIFQSNSISTKLTQNHIKHICFGDTITLSGDKSFNSIHAWDDGDTSITKRIYESGVYYFTTTWGNGCNRIDTFTVLDDSIPYIILSDTLAIQCINNIKNISALTNGMNYYWITPDKNLSYSYSISPLNEGLYTFYSYNQYEDYIVCAISSKIRVSYKTPPINDRDKVEYIKICHGEKLFYRYDTDDDVSYKWSTGDFTSSIIIKDTGLYALVISDDYCDSDTIKIYVSYAQIYPEVFIYNSFSPNNDGLNDDWNPFDQIYDINEYELVIFNRWGEIIFKSNNPLVRWGGNAPGVYGYTCYISHCSGPRTYKGSIHVIQ